MSGRPSLLNRGDVAILISGLLWGTVWIPVRALHESDGGGWATLIAFGIAFGLMVPVIVWQWRACLALGWAWVAIGFFMAAEFLIYTDALLRGQVARVLLLFYLLGIWVTLFERLFYGQRMTRERAAAIFLGIGGLAVMVGPDALKGSFSIADGMAIFAGMLFAIVIMVLNKTADAPTGARTAAAFVFLLPGFFIVAAFPGGMDMPTQTPLDRATWGWIWVYAGLWLVAAFWLSFYGSSRTTPGRAAIFFMMEVVLAAVTASYLAGETMTTTEIIGAVFIVSAGFVEAVGLGPLSRHLPKAPKS